MPVARMPDKTMKELNTDSAAGRAGWPPTHAFTYRLGLVPMIEAAEAVLDPAELSGVQSVTVPVDRF